MFSSRFTDNDVKAFVLHDHFLNRFCPVDLDLIGQKIKMLLIDKVANLVEQIKVQVSFGGFGLDAVWLIC
ncbi:MAG: hypothetical protein EOO20_15375 [Chryseobacterium sp.]|nr:MAG: hypothetical protein EOO20_15375 [Chryseobacterium sp.]